MNKYWQVFIRFRKMNLMILLERRADFFFWSSVAMMWSLFHFFFVYLLVSASGQIGNWNQNEVLLLMGVYTLFDAFTWSVLYQTFRNYTQRVFEGSMDMILTKPVDAQFLISVERNSYNNISRLLIGGMMFAYALKLQQVKPTIGQFILFIFLFCMSFVLVYSIWFFITTFSFWVERLNNINEIIPNMRNIMQFPRSAYTGSFAMILSTIFPVLLLVSVPSEILVNKMSVGWVIYFCLITVIFFVLSRTFFHYSLKKYSSAGS